MDWKGKAVLRTINSKLGCWMKPIIYTFRFEELRRNAKSMARQNGYTKANPDTQYPTVPWRNREGMAKPFSFGGAIWGRFIAEHYSWVDWNEKEGTHSVGIDNRDITSFMTFNGIVMIAFADFCTIDESPKAIWSQTNTILRVCKWNSNVLIEWIFVSIYTNW